MVAPVNDLGMPPAGDVPPRPWCCSHCGRAEATDEERLYGVHNACAETLRQRRTEKRERAQEARGSRRKGK